LRLSQNGSPFRIAASVQDCPLQFIFETTGNGREALAALEREDFDLVLMDVQMPEMASRQALRFEKKKN
jgi:CheY-like chemotaxis protein